MTFLPELLSMNVLMAGMQLTSRIAMANVNGGDDPARPEFWFIMSMALLTGFVLAYPMNWWLVANHMKHGMLTVRKEPSLSMATAGHAGGHGSTEQPAVQPKPTQPSTSAKAAMTAVSFAILGEALLIVTVFAG